MANLQQQKEIFKPILGYEGLYEISNLGRVKSCERYIERSCKSGKCFRKTEAIIKKTQIDRDGYVVIKLSKDGKKTHFGVHRLVAKAFIPNPENKPTVNHKLGVKTDNAVESLEWATLSEQNKHSLKFKLRRHPASIRPGMLGKFGKDHNQSKPVLQMDMNDVVIKEWDCAKDAVRQGGFTDTHISGCCRGLSKTHKGFKWKFK